MLGIVVSREDEASVAIGEALREVEDWEREHDDERSDADGGGTVFRTEGATLREFEDRHLDLDRPADAFGDLDLLVFASKHAGETGRLLTAHHTGNAGPADHGGEPNALARACPNAHARVLAALAEYAQEDYDVGMEGTHHGPTDVGAPSMFVEVGSGPEQWADDAAARAVARAILDLRGVGPDRDPEVAENGRSEGADDRTRRHLVGLGGGHYAPRFERVVRETDWAVGHVIPDWGLTALGDPDSRDGRRVLETAFEESRAVYALVDGDRDELAETVADLGYRPVSETWVRETDGRSLALVRDLEAAFRAIDDGLRLGERTLGPGTDRRAADCGGHELPAELLEAALGIDEDRTKRLLAAESIAYGTEHGGTRPDGLVVLESEKRLETIVEGLLAVLRKRYDEVERAGQQIVAREETFDPDLARTLGVPDGPAFGRLANGEVVEVDGDRIPPEAVARERERRFPLEIVRVDDE